MKRIIAGIALSLLWVSAALAQSSPGLTTGQVPTAAQWNSYFAAKQDTLGFTPLNRAGGVMTGKLVTVAATTLSAGFNVSPGVAPSVPNNGDIWVTTTGMFYRANGVTFGPLIGAGGGTFAATAPLSVTFPASVVTYALNYDSVFTTNGSSQLALASVASGSLIANSGAGSAEPVESTPSAWLSRWCSSSSDRVVYSTGASTWGCLQLLGLAHTWSGQQTFVAPILGTATATAIGVGGAAPATGISVQGAAVLPSGNGQFQLGAGSSTGAIIYGQGSVTDVLIANKSGTTACSVATGVTTWSCVIVDVSTGFRVAGGATSANYLRGNGTNFVSSAIQAGDLPGSFSGFGNPTNPGVNLVGANGVATTAMRSDAVLILDQTITPTWTGQHVHLVARTIASATGTLDDVQVSQATTTVTGSSAITRFNKVGIYTPTYTDASSVTITDANTVYIAAAPTCSGSVTCTNTWALYSGGNVRTPSTILNTATGILPVTDNTYDIGNSTTRYRDWFVGRKLFVPLMLPISDSTTAVQLTKADGTTVIMDWDTTNRRVGINKTPGAFDLDVNGAAAFGGSVTLTGGLSTPLVVAQGGTASATIVGARQTLNVLGDTGTGHGDAGVTIGNTERFAYTNAAFSTSRAWVLPAANVTGQPYAVIVADMAGGVTASNTLVITRAGSDTINGGSTVTMNAANSGYLCYSDGSSKWSCQPFGGGSGGGLTSVVVAAGTGLAVSGSCNPLASSSTCTVGMSSARATNPTVSRCGSGLTCNNSGQTYTTPSNVVTLEIRACGAGGGGAGVTQTTTKVGGSNGNNTTFNSVVANGGAGAGTGNMAPAGAGGTGGTGTATLRAPGGAGGPGGFAQVTVGWPGGSGGSSSFFGGAGVGGGSASGGTGQTGGAGGTNTGGGGGGAYDGATNFLNGGGGGGGECFYLLINSPSATYSYTGGTGGAGGVGGNATGGAGADGQIFIIERYNS